MSEERDPDRDDTLLSSSSPSLGDSEDAQLLRELAYAPPRRLPHEVAPGTPWSESGRFIIEKPLGRGGMGTVYAARDTRLERTVAIKVLDAAEPDRDAAHNARLLREAKLAASFSHQRIAQIYDVDTHRGFGFVAMEYVEGGTLRKWMADRERRADPAMRLPEVLALAQQIAEGLATLHAKRIVHGDLKPENVMLDAAGDVKLVDFGLARYAAAAAGPGDGAGGAGAARWAEASSERSQFTGGTPGYMAPEQYEGQHGDPRADVFALGVVICELVIGKRLLRATAVPTSATTASSIAAGTPSGTAAEAFASIRQVSRTAAAQLQGTPWEALPPPMRALTQKLLACDPAERFADGAEALAALRAVGTSALTPSPSSRRTRARRFALPAIAAVLGVIGLGWAFHWRPFASTSDARPAIIPAGMVRIPGGTLTVGHTAEEIERECREIGPGCAEVQMRREIPRATIHVAPFFLDRDEVTNEDFAAMLDTYTGTLAVRDDEDYHYPRFVVRNTGGADGRREVLYDLNPAKGGVEYVNRRNYQPLAGRAQLPAAQATWYGAKLYCESRGKRLPTEDEWEAAARGRDNRRFPWGDALPRCGEVNVPSDGQLGALPMCLATMRAVGTSPQDVTPQGVRDLGGNAVEWTDSRYVEGDRTAHPTSGPADGPRVIRGGSWVESVMARSSGRSKRPADFMGANLGFRCASDIPPTKPSP